MSEDTIYREDAIKAINLKARIPHDVASAHYANMAINAIRSVPSADRPQGEWRDLDGNFVPLDEDGCTTASVWCANCGEWLTGSDEYRTSGRFCPSCGARMKGADDESVDSN